MKSTLTFKRRYVTLIEMMIVMFLIALITGVIAYNYRGSLDEGKAFKTGQAINRIQDVLNLQLSENPELAQNINSEWKEMIRSSPLIQNASAYTRDGWGGEYQVSVEDNVVHVHSDKYDDYLRKTKSMFGK